MIKLDRSMVDRLMETTGQQFEIIRDGNIIGEVVGAKSGKSKGHPQVISLYPEADVRTHDWLRGKITEEKFYIKDTDITVIKGKAFMKHAYYQTESEHEKAQNQSREPTFHIENAFGSIIGAQNTATINNSYNLEEIREKLNQQNLPDKEQLNDLIDTLKAITENNIPVQKGTLSRFSDLLEKHSWFMGALAESVFSWLIGK